MPRERRTATMTQHAHVPIRTEDYSADTVAPGGHTVASQDCHAPLACGMKHRGLKGMVLMMACCAAPLLLVLALPVLGTSLRGGIALSVHTLAVFACPVGMALIMWMMRRGQAKAAHLRQDERSRSTRLLSAHVIPSPEGPLYVKKAQQGAYYGTQHRTRNASGSDGHPADHGSGRGAAVEHI